MKPLSHVSYPLIWRWLDLQLVPAIAFIPVLVLILSHRAMWEVC